MDYSDPIEDTISVEDEGSSHKRASANNAEEESLVRSMHEKLNALSQRPSTIDGPTIFRVPANLRKNKKYLIEPSVVSIGPYHRGRKHLAPMEEKKWLLLQEVLSRPSNEVTLKECVQKIRGLQLRARSCYSERVDMADDRFVEMLILDGTFIIQFFNSDTYLPWFERETGRASTCIATDLILLENQIPFFVIQSLWDLYFSSPIYLDNLKHFRGMLCPGFQSSGDITIPQNEFQLGNITIPQNELQSGNVAIPENAFHHLLHLCHHYVVPDMAAHETVPTGCSCFKFCTILNFHHLLPCESTKHEIACIYKIPCATELEEAGIKFRKKYPHNM